MLFADEERDEDRDPKEDADLDQPSDEDEEDEDDAEGDEDEESDEEGDEPSEDDDKPITRKELKEILKSNQNKNNAKRRVSSNKDRPSNKPPKPNDRLDRLEQSLKRTELLERKRTFGYENSLSPAEVDVVFRLTKRPTKKFLDEPYVKGALTAIREQSNVRKNTPGSGGPTFKGAGGKSWSDLKPEEKEASFADRRRAILESKKNR